jgi:hypothetical protein
MAGLDERYITPVGLLEYFVDKETGEPLAGGLISFWQDDNRLYPKTVYELTGAPPNYSYSPLPNPMTLSATGTPMNANGDEVKIYYYPYDQFGNLELYYVTVTDSNGLDQFTRQGQPNISEGNNPANEGELGFNNLISNSQFVDVLFNPSSTLTISYTGSGTKRVNIAPDWQLVISHGGSGSVQVSRESIAGTALNQTNPPYVLSIVPGANITQLRLIQKLEHNPSIWSPVVPGQLGYVNAGILIAQGIGEVKLIYVSEAVGTEQTILTATNNTGAPFYFSDTAQLTVSDNTSNADIGYVNLIIDLPPSGTGIKISSVQFLGIETDEVSIPYQQQPVNRQKDYLFHYYQPFIQNMPIPSYLVGWDFPMNPAQISGNSVNLGAIGANKSAYTWDQTIVFQSANSGVNVNRSTTGRIQLNALADGQIAIIQYLDAVQANKIINSRNAVNIIGGSTIFGGLTGTVSLWVTDDVSLPNVAAGTNNSIVLTLDANGKPATRNGTWTEIPRSDLGDATISLGTTEAEYNLSGWDATNTIVTNQTFFAIVIGFAAMSNGATVELKSVSLCEGEIATPPCPLTVEETLRQCEQYYEKSYKTSDIAGTASTTVNAINRPQITTLPSANKAHFEAGAFSVDFRTLKRSVTPTISIYPGSTNTVGNLDATIKALGATTTTTVSNTLAIAQWTIANLGDKTFTYLPNYGDNANPAIDPLNDAANFFARSWITFHYVADARLGIV